MGWVEFVATVIKAGIWPVTVLVIVLLFRGRLTEILDSGLTKLKAGPFEAEWQQAALEARAAVEVEDAESGPTLPAGSVGAGDSTLDRLRHLVPSSPELAIIGGFQMAERRLNEVAGTESDAAERRRNHMTLREDGFNIFRRGLLGEAALIALDRLRRMRNLAVHEPTRVTPQQAAEYLDLVDAVLGQLDEVEKLTQADGLLSQSDDLGS